MTKKRKKVNPTEAKTSCPGCSGALSMCSFDQGHGVNLCGKGLLCLLLETVKFSCDVQPTHLPTEPVIENEGEVLEVQLKQVKRVVDNV